MIKAIRIIALSTYEYEALVHMPDGTCRLIVCDKLYKLFKEIENCQVLEQM